MSGNIKADQPGAHRSLCAGRDVENQLVVGLALPVGGCGAVTIPGTDEPTVGECHLVTFALRHRTARACS